MFPACASEMPPPAEKVVVATHEGEPAFHDRTCPAVPMPYKVVPKVDVEMAVGTAEPPVPLAMMELAACAASEVSDKEPVTCEPKLSEPEMVESVEVGAAYTLPFASTPSPELERPAKVKLPAIERAVVEAYGNCEAAAVEDAKKTPWVEMDEVVAAEVVLKTVSEVNG